MAVEKTPSETEMGKRLGALDAYRNSSDMVTEFASQIKIDDDPVEIRKKLNELAQQLRQMGIKAGKGE